MIHFLKKFRLADIGECDRTGRRAPENTFPGPVGRQGFQFREGHLVVIFFRVAKLDVGTRGFGERGLQVHHGFGFRAA